MKRKKHLTKIENKKNKTNLKIINFNFSITNLYCKFTKKY